MASRVLIGLLVNVFFAALAFIARSVTLSGALSGLLLGTWIYSFLGARGFFVVAAFFILGSLFTRLGFQAKEARGIAQRMGGRRTYREAFANGLVGALFATLVFFTGNFLYSIAFVASFATALADTTATELGSLYGRRPFLFPSFKRVAPGTLGAVSLEGTLFGIAAAGFLTFFSFFLNLIQKQDILVVILGSAIGFLAESLLAGLPFRVDHDVRNLLNTLFGATAAMMLGRIFY